MRKQHWKKRGCCWSSGWTIPNWCVRNRWNHRQKVAVCQNCPYQLIQELNSDSKNSWYKFCIIQYFETGLMWFTFQFVIHFFCFKIFFAIFQIMNSILNCCYYERWQNRSYPKLGILHPFLQIILYYHIPFHLFLKINVK